MGAIIEVFPQYLMDQLLYPPWTQWILVNDQPSHKRCTYEYLTEFDNDDIFQKPIANDKDDTLSSESEKLDHPKTLQ